MRNIDSRQERAEAITTSIDREGIIFEGTL